MKAIKLKYDMILKERSISINRTDNVMIYELETVCLFGSNYTTEQRNREMYISLNIQKQFNEALWTEMKDLNNSERIEYINNFLIEWIPIYLKDKEWKINPETEEKIFGVGQAPVKVVKEFPLKSKYDELYEKYFCLVDELDNKLDSKDLLADKFEVIEI